MTNQEFGQFYSRLQQYGQIICAKVFLSEGFEWKVEHWKFKNVHYIVLGTAGFNYRIQIIGFNEED